MKRTILSLALSFTATSFISCAGIKVINPNDQNENSGTLALDISGGQAKLLATYTCKLESVGTRISAVAKSEGEARNEVIAKCHDRTLFSICDSEKVTCEKN